MPCLQLSTIHAVSSNATLCVSSISKTSMALSSSPMRSSWIGLLPWSSCRIIRFVSLVVVIMSRCEASAIQVSSDSVFQHQTFPCRVQLGKLILMHRIVVSSSCSGLSFSSSISTIFTPSSISRPHPGLQHQPTKPRPSQLHSSYQIPQQY